jgi:hypothetical protein
LEVHGAFCSRNLSSPVAAEASASAAVGQGSITGGAAAGVVAADGTGVDAAVGLREDDGEAVHCEFCGLEFGCAAIVAHAEYCGSRTERCDDCRRYIALRDLPAHVVSGCGLPSRDSVADYPALGSTRQSLVPRSQVRPRPAGLVGRFHSRQGLTVAACRGRGGWKTRARPARTARRSVATGRGCCCTWRPPPATRPPSWPSSLGAGRPGFSRRRSWPSGRRARPGGWRWRSAGEGTCSASTTTRRRPTLAATAARQSARATGAPRSADRRQHSPASRLTARLKPGAGRAGLRLRRLRGLL